MNTFSTVLLFSLLLTSSCLWASTESVEVVYGEDNRMDVFESKNSALVELSESTAAMIAARNLKVKEHEVEIIGAPLSARGVCTTERFSKQITAANCSGFLVGENVLVTAGHCIEDMHDCQGSSWVFGFKIDHADQVSVTVPKSDVYSCKRIIERALSPFTKDDYAVIELDRKTDRRPLAFRKRGEIMEGTTLAMIGHPSGLPAKIATGAKVRSVDHKFFVTNLDAFGGNSGSAVFNMRTHEVEGILVRGEEDYVYNVNYQCEMPKVCSNDSCRGEDVTKITNIRAIKNL